MKGLSNFLEFDFTRFSNGKRYLSLGCSPWKDYRSGEILGTKAMVVIAQDKTKYSDNDEIKISNLYEKLSIKVPKDITVPDNVEVKIINAQAKVYGDYHNNLSIVADDIEVVSK